MVALFQLRIEQYIFLVNLLIIIIIIIKRLPTQVSWLHNSAKEVVLVTSGAVAFGMQRMRQERVLSQTIRSALFSPHVQEGVGQGEVEPRACAAAGQAGLMALYESMFAQYGISCAQVYVCVICGYFIYGD